MPRNLEAVPESESVLLSKEQQAGPGQTNSCGLEAIARWSILYSPGESVQAVLFCPARPEITAFVSCEDRGLDETGRFVEQYCFAKGTSDEDWARFSFPPEEPTRWVAEFLDVGGTVLLPGDRDYGPDEEAERQIDCEALAARVPRVVTRRLQDCYATSATSRGGPDYRGCRKTAFERYDHMIRDLASAGCLGDSEPSLDLVYERFFALARAAAEADAEARTLDWESSGGDSLQCPCWEGLRAGDLSAGIGEACLTRPNSLVCTEDRNVATFVSIVAVSFLCADNSAEDFEGLAAFDCPGGCFYRGEGGSSHSALAPDVLQNCRAEAAAALGPCCG